MMKIPVTLSLVFFMCAALSPAQGSTISNVFGAATGYNAFLFGNFSDSCCDVGGNLAVGGTTTVNNFAVGQSYYSGSASGVKYSYQGIGKLSGTFSLGAGNGYYAAGGTYNGPTYYKTTSGAIYLSNASQTVAAAGAATDFNAAQISLTQYSNYLASLAPTGAVTASQSGGFDIPAPNVAQTNVVSLSYAQLAGGALHINLAVGATLLINVTADGTGSATTSNNGIFVNGTQQFGNGARGANSIVFNFTGLNFTANETIVGTVLAPSATFKGNNNQQLDGALIARNFVGNTEFHDDLFTGNLPVQQVATPEPMSFVLLGAGLFAVGVGVKRKKLRG